MKRYLALLLAMIMMLSLAACGGEPQTQEPQTPDTPAPPANPEQVQGDAEQIIEEKEYLKTYKTSFSSSYASFNYFSTAYSTVRGIVANRAKMQQNLNESLMLVTALNPYIGYENAAKTARLAYAEGITLKEACVRLGFLSEEKFDEVFQPEEMV